VCGLRILELGVGAIERAGEGLHCPYAPVVIEMEEGVRILSEVVDCPPDELEIDMPVGVVFEDVTEEVTLPKFRRIASGVALDPEASATPRE
jgi:hypothetical protein